MSQFTDYAKNKLADFMRGQTLTLASAWYMALGSAASANTFTELSGTGYARLTATRNLTNWSGTQGAGTTLASTGTSHSTSNNILLNWGTSGGAWGTASHVGFFDASTGGNAWIWLPLASVLPIAGSGVAVSLAIGAVAVTLGLTGGMTDYAANKLIDLIFRAQAYTWPATLYDALFTVAPTNAGGGTEVAGGSYARAGIVSTLAAWSGTQAAGSTAASSGTSGRISNNASLTFPAPTASWGTAVAEGLIDAASGGNLMFWALLASARTIASGSSPQTHAADTLSISLA